MEKRSPVRRARSSPASIGRLAVVPEGERFETRSAAARGVCGAFGFFDARGRPRLAGRLSAPAASRKSLPEHSWLSLVARIFLARRREADRHGSTLNRGVAKCPLTDIPPFRSFMNRFARNGRDRNSHRGRKPAARGTRIAQTHVSLSMQTSMPREINRIARSTSVVLNNSPFSLCVSPFIAFQ